MSGSSTSMRSGSAGRLGRRSRLLTPIVRAAAWGSTSADRLRIGSHHQQPIPSPEIIPFRPNPTTTEIIMPFARIDLIKGKTPEYRAAVADIVYRGIVDVLKAPDGDRFIVVSEHTADNLIYDPNFLGFDRSPDFLLIQVTSTVGNDKASKLAFFRFIADELKEKDR